MWRCGDVDVGVGVRMYGCGYGQSEDDLAGHKISRCFITLTFFQMNRKQKCFMQYILWLGENVIVPDFVNMRVPGKIPSLSIYLYAYISSQTHTYISFIPFSHYNSPGKHCNTLLISLGHMDNTTLNRCLILGSLVTWSARRALWW